MNNTPILQIMASDTLWRQDVSSLDLKLRLVEGAKDRKIEPSIPLLLDVAEIHFRKGDYDKSLEAVKGLGGIQDGIPPRDKIRLSSLYGHIAFIEGYYEFQDIKYKEVFEFASQLGANYLGNPAILVGNSNFVRGIVEQSSGLLDVAEQRYKEAERIGKETERGDIEGNAILSQAILRYHSSSHGQERGLFNITMNDFFERSEALLQMDGIPYSLSILEHYKSLCHGEGGDYILAFEHLSKAREFNAVVGNRIIEKAINIVENRIRENIGDESFQRIKDSLFKNK